MSGILARSMRQVVQSTEYGVQDKKHKILIYFTMLYSCTLYFSTDHLIPHATPPDPRPSSDQDHHKPFRPVNAENQVFFRCRRCGWGR